MRRRKLGPPAGAWVYELTEWGQQLEPVLAHLGRWGIRSPSLDGSGAVSVDALMLALRSLFDPEASGDLRATYQLRFGDDRLAVHVDAAGIDVTRGEVSIPDVTLELDPKTFAALLTKRVCVDDAACTGRLTLTGNPALVERLFDAFSLPKPAD